VRRHHHKSATRSGRNRFVGLAAYSALAAISFALALTGLSRHSAFATDTAQIFSAVAPVKEGQYPAIRLALYESEEAAKAHWDWAVKSHPSFAELTPLIADQPLKRGMFIALFAVGKSLSELRAECAAFAAKGGECLLTPVREANIRYALSTPSGEPAGRKIIAARKTPQRPALRGSISEREGAAPSVSAVRRQLPEKMPPAREQRASLPPASEPSAPEHRSGANSADLRIVMAGDVMMGTAHPYQSYLNPALKPGRAVEKVISPELVAIFDEADLALINLEGVLFDDEGPVKSCARNCYAFRSPTYYAYFIKELGVDAVSLANNHAGDFFEAGRRSTINALNSLEIAHAGSDRDGARTASFERNGLRIGFIAFGTSPDVLNLLNLDSARRRVTELKRDHDIIVVSVHGGAEGEHETRVPAGGEYYLGEYRGDLRRFNQAMVDAGADLVFGHGPHVPRALQLYKGRLIAYSLVNFWTYLGMRSDGPFGTGPILEATLTHDGRLKALAIHSTHQRGLGVPALDPSHSARRMVLRLTALDFPESLPDIERMMNIAAAPGS
jgi:hypothetical protein